RRCTMKSQSPASRSSPNTAGSQTKLPRREASCIDLNLLRILPSLTCRRGCARQVRRGEDYGLSLRFSTHKQRAKGEPNSNPPHWHKTHALCGSAGECTAPSAGRRSGPPRRSEHLQRSATPRRREGGVEHTEVFTVQCELEGRAVFLHVRAVRCLGNDHHLV